MVLMKTSNGWQMSNEDILELAALERECTWTKQNGKAPVPDSSPEMVPDSSPELVPDSSPEMVPDSSPEKLTTRYENDHHKKRKRMSHSKRQMDSLAAQAPDSYPEKSSTRYEHDHQKKRKRRAYSERQMYSLAGQAHKEKYAKLRKNQKARLSKRCVQPVPETITVQAVPEPRTTPLFAESHTSVLLGFIKAAELKNQWTDEELDSLWVGVRRHGTQNWEAMLQDPWLTFSRFKKAEDLEARWNQEDLRNAFPCLNGK